MKREMMAIALVMLPFLAGAEEKPKNDQPLVTIEAAKEMIWMTDFKAASEKAKTENKPMLLDFTGSDWCGWCKKLDKEVFSTKTFKDYADKNLVLVMLDFPRRKEQSNETKAQNRKLQETYSVEGYPTIVLLDPSGHEVGRTGYQEGGAEAYVKHLDGIIKGNGKK